MIYTYRPAIDHRTIRRCSFYQFAVIGIGIPKLPHSLRWDLLKNAGISEVNPQTGYIVIVDPEIEGQAVIPGQAGNGHTGSGAAGQRHSLAEGTAVHVICRAVLGVKGPVEAGTVGIVAVKVLEAQGIRIIRDQLVICHVIVQVQAGHLGGGEGGAVAPVLQLVVVDVGHVPDVLVVLVVRGVVGVIDGNKGGGVLDVYQIILVCAVVDGDVIAAVVLVVIEVILRVVVLGEIGIVVVIGGVVVVPGLEVRAVSVLIGDIVRCVVVEEVRKFNISLVIVRCRIVGGIVNGIERLVVAVNDFRIGRVPASVIVRHIAGTIYYTTGTDCVIVLWFGRSIFIKRGLNRNIFTINLKESFMIPYPVTN